MFLFSECSIRKLFLLGDSLLFVSGQIQSQLVSWCFEPSQPQRITSGLNANITLSPSHSFYKSSYHKSCFFLVFFYPIYIPLALNTGTCIQQGDLFYSAGLHRNHVLATDKTGKKNQGRLWKNAGEWTGGVEKSKEEIPGSKRRHLWLYTNLLQALKRVCILTRRDFNFCVRSSPRRAGNGFENKTFNISGFSLEGTLPFLVRSKTSAPTGEGSGEGGGGWEGVCVCVCGRGGGLLEYIPGSVTSVLIMLKPGIAENTTLIQREPCLGSGQARSRSKGDQVCARPIDFPTTSPRQEQQPKQECVWCRSMGGGGDETRRGAEGQWERCP